MYKKILSFVLVFVMVFTTIPFGSFSNIKISKADGFTGSGNGLVDDPFIITNCNELQQMNLDLESYFKLDGPSGIIDCSMTNPSDPDFDGGGVWADEKGFLPVGIKDGNYGIDTPFSGNLDGNNNVIKNLYINRPDEYFDGLYTAIDRGSNIHDFGLEDVNIVGSSYVGALAGALSGTVTNVHSTGTVHGNFKVGGLVGSHVDNNSWYDSSPLVYTWDGNEYKYVADVGNLLPKEVGNALDSATIDKLDLVPQNGKYSMKIGEEYNEIVYYDKLALKTYDHAPGYSIAVPLNRTATADDVVTVNDTPTNPLLACTDTYGNDCTDNLKANDDKWAVQDKSFVNSYVMDFGNLANKDNIQLVMRAARDYSASAKMRDAGTYQSLRTIQVKDANGNWVEIYNKKDLGSDGTPRLRTINLTNKFLSDDYHVKVGFDTQHVNYFAVDTSEQIPFTVNTYEPTKADMSFFGFSEINKTPYVNHNYNKVTNIPNDLFKMQYGNFTKYGDVLTLLTNSDNKFVIMKGGDQMDIEFPYVAPEDGMVRDFILDNNVWYKHASNDSIGLLGKTVDPLPYNGMTEYKSDSNGYPMTEENINYLNEYNTRVYEGTPKEEKKAGSTIINSYSSVDVSGNDDTGGLVGYNEKEIKYSYATGNVSGDCSVGGLVGYNEDQGSTGFIHDSYSTGNVDGYCNVGGLVGLNVAITQRSYSSGNVHGNTNVGGLIGNSYSNDVYGSFAVGSVSGIDNSIGGLIGWSSGSINNLGWVTNSGPDYAIGVDSNNEWEPNNVTYNENDTKFFKNYKSDIYTSNEFDPWDFDTIWGINPKENDGYPFLRWQGFTHKPGSTHATSSGSYVGGNHFVVVETPKVPEVKDTKNEIPPTDTKDIPKALSKIQTVKVDLKFGMKNNSDVKILQEFLIAQMQGDAVHDLVKFGATGNFGKITQKALADWQSGNGITPASGYFGKITRKYISDKNL